MLFVKSLMSDTLICLCKKQKCLTFTKEQVFPASFQVGGLLGHTECFFSCNSEDAWGRGIGEAAFWPHPATSVTETGNHYQVPASKQSLWDSTCSFRISSYSPLLMEDVVYIRCFHVNKKKRQLIYKGCDFESITDTFAVYSMLNKDSSCTVYLK